MMSVKKMIDLYITYNLSNDTWEMMWNMANHGLISRDNWEKFWKKCKGWTLTEDGQSVEDENGKIIYTRDNEGFLVKA